MAYLACLVDLVHDWYRSHRVRQSQIWEELVVYELKQCHVELGERSHHFVVNIERQPLVEFVWLYPRDRLAHDLDTEIDTFDGAECLCEALAYRAVEQEFLIQLSTCLDVFFAHLECQMLWQLCIEWDQTQGIVKVSQSINKAWVSVFDHRCQILLWSLFHVCLSDFNLASAQIFFVLF